jgi:ribonuclease BN (tRNA processing enzyme)
VRHGDDVLLIDAGTGLQRLIEQPELLEGSRNVHVVLTHFHLDHVVGLSYLPALRLNPAPVIWGPGECLYDTSTRAILERLLAPPLFSAPIDAFAADVRELAPGKRWICSFSVDARVQERHSEPTLALRIGDTLTYCTDTAPDPENIAFAKGSRVLLHEAWYPQSTHHDGTHSAAGDAGRIAAAAGVQRLVLIHIHPLETSDDRLEAHARHEFAGTEVAHDLASIPLMD